MKNLDWSLIAKKAWETRRKNQGNSERVQRKSKNDGENFSDEDKWEMRMFGEEYVVGDEWMDELYREQAKMMEKKELMEKALGVHRENGIGFGNGNERKVKIERWSGGVRFESI